MLWLVVVCLAASWLEAGRRRSSRESALAGKGTHLQYWKSEARSAEERLAASHSQLIALERRADAERRS